MGRVRVEESAGSQQDGLSGGADAHAERKSRAVHGSTRFLVANEVTRVFVSGARLNNRVMPQLPGVFVNRSGFDAASFCEEDAGHVEALSGRAARACGEDGP